MESRQHCAYNQTRGCFLSLDVEAGDFSPASLDDWMPKLTPNSGMGLWLVPFRGIPTTGVRVPLDLIYLDEDSRVIAAVESFPVSRVSPSCPPAASVLALPTLSISSTHTQPGDELLLCAAEEMTWLLERSSSASGAAGAEPGAVPGPVFSSEESRRSTSPVLAQAENLSTEQRPDPPGPPEKAPARPETKKAKPQRSWLERWLFPDPPDEDQRSGQRQVAPGLAAHFWTGGAPQKHSIRDISATGLYVVTTERWYPGTQIRITLTKTDERETGAQRSITVQATAVRWGNDGVGLEFVVQDPRNMRRGQPLPYDGANREQLQQFLLRLKSGSR